MDATSKTAKKNKKRKGKKTSIKLGSSDHDADQVLSILKEELVIAKREKDHAKAGKLRDQIWVLTDIVAGIKTDIPDEQLLPILESLPLQSAPKDHSEAPKAAASCLSSTDRRLHNLNKKLDQIEVLKVMQANGDKLEVNQITKIETESTIREEIKEIEEIIASIQITK